MPAYMMILVPWVGPFLVIFYFSTMKTKIPLRRMGGTKMTIDTKMQTIPKYTLGKFLVGGSFLEKNMLVSCRPKYLE